MKVRGRDFEWSKRDIEQAMRGESPDTIQKHVVGVNGTLYPPKQVLGRVTGWPRISFTTAEAQRVLTRIGFVCREAVTAPGAQLGWVVTDDEPQQPSATDERIAALEAALATAQEAIAGLAARVRALEAHA